MGGLSSVLAVLPAVAKGFEAVASREQQREQNKLAQRQLEQTQKIQQQQAAENAALEKENLALQTVQTEEERRAALRRAVARQRANFGAQGVGSADGSAQAVLLGLFEESDAERARREQMDALRVKGIDQGLSQMRSLNILQRQQLQEKNKLASYADDRSFAQRLL